MMRTARTFWDSSPKIIFQSGFTATIILKLTRRFWRKKGRVGRNHYTSPAQYVHRHSITTYGSIVTKQRYGFAWTDDTGYDIRNLYFDNNLIYYPPPFFPTGDKYQIDLWEEL